MTTNPIPSPPRSGGEGQGEGERRVATALARRLRRAPTWAERTLWRCLRARRFAGFKFRRQHPFGPYVLDFYCVAANLAVELDGDIHGQPSRSDYDRERDKYLTERGVRLVRFWNVDLFENREEVLETIFNELQKLTTKDPHPDPLPCGQGRGEHEISSLAQRKS